MLIVPTVHVGRRSNRLKDILTQLGWLPNANCMVFDFGDENCVASGSDQTVNDLSGNGYHIWRGDTSGATSTDPTFNGVVGGLSQNEYFSGDGGDYFRISVAQPTFIQNMHKNSQSATVLGLIWWTGAANYQLEGNWNSGGGICHQCVVRGSDRYMRMSTADAVPNQYDAITTTLQVALNVWQFIGFSFSHNSGSGSDRRFYCNGGYQAINIYGAYSASNNSVGFDIAAGGAGSTPIPNTSRLALCTILGGVYFTQANFDAVYNRLIAGGRV